MYFKEGVSVIGENIDQVNIEHYAAGIYHLIVEMQGKQQQLILMVN